MKKLRYIFPIISILFFVSAPFVMAQSSFTPPGAIPGIGDESRAKAAAQASAQSGTSSCWLDPLCWVAKISSTVLLSVTGALTRISAVALNQSIFYTVVQMSQNYSKLPVIADTWGTVRDLANMAFIFVLLYISIQMILGNSQNRKLLVNIILAAILVNFSLFFTRVIIDASNLLALTFYTGITGTTDVSKLSDVSNFGVANGFMDVINVTTLWKMPGNPSDIVLAIIGLLGSVLLLICAFVFFAVAIMLVIRYVILILVLILSPLMFVGMILPSFNKYKEKWFDALLGQAFFAPAYFFMTWIALRVSYAIKFALMGSNNPAWSDAFAGTFTEKGGDITSFFSANTMNLVVLFAIVITLVVASLVIAKSQAGKAGALANKATAWATGFAGGATFGLAGRAGRATLGRAGQALAESETLKQLAPESRAARLALAVGRKTGSSSFDLRSSLSDVKGLGAGKPQKGGYAQDLKKVIDTEKKTAQSLRPSEFKISQAERELKKSKEADVENEAFIKEWSNAKVGKEKELQGHREELAKAQKRGAAPEELDYIEEKIKDAELEQSEMSTIQGYKTFKQKNVQVAVDKLKGAGKERQERYAQNLEKRAGSVFGRDDEKLRAADEIRKGLKQKSAKDALVEAAKRVAEEEAPTPAPTPAAPNVTTTT